VIPPPLRASSGTTDVSAETERKIMSTIEIRAIPVIRYVLTKYENNGKRAGSTPLGEFANAKAVNYVGQEVAKANDCEFHAAPALRIRWADDPAREDGEHD